MPPTFRFHHMHLLTRDPKGTAQYYHKMFDAKIIESVQSDGKPRIDLDMNGVSVFVLPVAPGEKRPDSPAGPYVGLDHFGFAVSDLDEAAAELKRRGAEFFLEPRTIRPGVKIAFVRGPENVRIELVERKN
jgi:lactoylglutathione lyase